MAATGCHVLPGPGAGRRGPPFGFGARLRLRFGLGFRPGHRLSVGLALALITATTTGAARADAVRPLFIEGYAGRVSCRPGETVGLHISTTAPTFAVEIARLGAKREVVFTKADVPGRESPVPENASSHGCGWPALVEVPVDDAWRSGYYEVILRAADRGGKYTGRGRRTAESSCYFIVRPATPGATSPILLQLSTNTYNAYNNWGGTSLYAYNGRAGAQGHRVSFLRPPSSQFGRWEQPFVAWAESQGIALEFAANLDLEARPADLAAYRLVLSVGHDEYWSSPMRDHLEAFIGHGGNVAFFSGNTCCWQVRSEDDGTALVSWKQRCTGPITGSLPVRSSSAAASSAVSTRSWATSATAASSNSSTACPCPPIATARPTPSRSSPPARRSGIPTTPSSTTAFPPIAWERPCSAPIPAVARS
jgi:hypothetical protein